MLRFQASQTERGATLVLRVDPNGMQFPLFSFTASKSSKPNIVVYRVGVGYSMLQPTYIGDATLHSMSSKIDLRWNNQAIQIKGSDIWGNRKLDCHPFGSFKWESGKATGYKLKDGSGNQIARYQSGWTGIEGASLEIPMQCDDSFLDIIVLSLIAVVQADSQTWAYAF